MTEISFYLFVFTTLASFMFLVVNWVFIASKNNKLNTYQAPFSIIIAAKNEEKRVSKLLHALENIKYKTFEIVLVNDASTDKTLDIFNNFKKKNI